MTPRNTSPGPIGVATIPWNVRIHLVPAMIGQSDSPAAACIAAAAMSPGVTNAR